MNATENKIAEARKIVTQLQKARKNASNRGTWEEYGVAIKEYKAEIQQLQANSK